MEKIKWTMGEDRVEPVGKSLDALLYDIRRQDHAEGLIFDSLTLAEVLAAADERMSLDALVIPFARMSQRMDLLLNVMSRAGIEVKPLSMQVSEPFKQHGVVNVVALFELSDGQTISAYFHNPDSTPTKLAATDEMISWKWLLNKKDITIIAAPEKGADLNVREVARRIMRLAEKNSASFMRVNAKRADRMANIASLKESVASKESLLSALQGELESKKKALENKQKAIENRAPSATAEATAPDAESSKDLEDDGSSTESSPAEDAKIVVHGTSADQSLAERLTAANILYTESKGTVFLGKTNKATGNVVSMQYTNNKQVSDAVEKLRVAGFEAHGTAQHPFRVVITGVSSQITDEDLAELNKGFANPPHAEKIPDQEEPSSVAISGNELGDFPDTKDGKKLMRAAAEEAFAKLVEDGAWVTCPSLGADVELRTKGLKKVISNSADVRKLKIIPHIKELIANSKKVGEEKPNYDRAKTPNIVGYQTMRALVNIGNDELAVRFVFGRDDKGSYHYDQTIHPLEAVFDCVNEKEPAEASSNGSMGGNLGCTYDRSTASEPTSLLSSDTSKEHRTDEILVKDGQESKQILDSVGASSREVFNLFIEGEDAEVVEDDSDSAVDPDVLIQNAIDDPIDNRAWDLPTEAIKGLTEDSFQSIMAKLTDENFHTENLVFMAKRVGTSEQLIEANVLNRSADKLEPSDYFDRREKLSTDLYAAQNAAFKAMAASMEPSEPQNQPSAPKVFNDEEQANYKPFNASALKMPTAQQLGIGATSRNILRLFKDSNDAQVDGWTNGHILDVFSEPPLIIDAQKAIEEDGSGSVGWIDYSRVEPIVSKSKAGTIQLTPVGAYEYLADEASKRYSAIAALQGKPAADIKSVVIGNEAENIALHINKYYFAYFFRTYKGAEFFTDKDGGNVLVKHRNKVVGVLMPIRLKGASTNRDDYAEDLARAKQGSAPQAPDVVKASLSVDEPATRGYQAAINGESNATPSDLSDEVDKAAWSLGYKKGLEAKVAEAAAEAPQVTQAPEVKQKRVTKKEVNEAIDSMDYTINDLHGHTMMEFRRAKVEERLRPKIELLKSLRDRGLPEGFNVDSRIESAEKMIARWKEDKDREITGDLSKANAWGYLQEKGVPFDEAQEILSRPTSKEAIPYMDRTIDFPRYSVEFLDAEIEKLNAAPELIVASDFPKLVDPVVATEGDTEKMKEKAEVAIEENPVDKAVAEAGNDPVQADPVHDLPHADELNVPLKDAVDHSGDISFMQSVIDGKADIWDTGLAGKLQDIHGRVSGNEELSAMWMKALKSYSSQALSFTQKTLSG